MKLALQVPINSVSFGNISIALLREMHKAGLAPCVFPIGNVDLSTQKVDKEFGGWLSQCINRAVSEHSRKTPIFKLWHLNGGLESYSERQVLLTFYETDNPTREELNVVRNNAHVFFSSEETVNIFKNFGCENVSYLPLGFDGANFKRTEKNYFADGRIVGGVVGKCELLRKRHEKVIKTWVKKFGGNSKHCLQCAIWNPFMKPEDNSMLVNKIMDGKRVFNVQFVPFMTTNEIYNDYLNSLDYVIGLGTENWGLPEFHSVAMGKHGIVLNAGGYKGWANNENCVLINPSSKLLAHDGMFFHKGAPYNQGNVWDFSEDDLLAGLDTVIQRVEANKINQAGLKLQEEFTWAKTLEKILKTLS